MLKLAIAFAALLLVVLAAGQVWRLSDVRAAREAWAALARTRSDLPERFDPAMLDGLPEPAARFFRFAIAPGTKLGTRAEIEMGGELGLGSKEAPGYQPMRARQILAAPEGLVWQVAAGTGASRIVGSDGMVADRSWTRFWLLGLLPVVRAGGDRDHLRASLGRAVAEAAFWTPAALLPQTGTTWEAADPDTARATVRHRGMVQTVDIHLAAVRRPTSVVIPRWSSANPEGRYQVQPFGGTLDDFRDVGGYRLPFRVDGGNFFGTEAYFPFFRAEVTAVRVLPAGP